MIDRKDFKEIKEGLEEFDANREQVILAARKILLLSKQIIYSVHRGDMPYASKLVSEIAKKIGELPKGDCGTGMEHVAVQEYVEAVCLYHYVEKKNLMPRKELDVGIEDYLIGLCDLTGELVRLAVNEAIKGNRDVTVEVKDFLTELYGEFLKFDIRNGELRKRSDTIKWNLRKLEDLTLEISALRK